MRSQYPLWQSLFAAQLAQRADEPLPEDEVDPELELLEVPDAPLEPVVALLAELEALAELEEEALAELAEREEELVEAAELPVLDEVPVLAADPAVVAEALLVLVEADDDAVDALDDVLETVTEGHAQLPVAESQERPAAEQTESLDVQRVAVLQTCASRSQ